MKRSRFALFERLVTRKGPAVMRLPSAILTPNSGGSPAREPLKKRAQAYRYISRIYRSRPQRCLRDLWIGVKPSAGGAGVKNIEPYGGTPRFEVAAPYSPVTMHSSLLRHRPGTKQGKSSAMRFSTSIFI